MNTQYTLKELANFGQMSAHMKLDGRSVMHVDPDGPYFEKDRPAREAFTKAILDAIGYEFPKDAEREAFDAWWKANRIAFCNEEHAFQLWKAGREELRQAINKPSYSTPEQIDESIQNLTTKEPAWIPWHGGDKSPIVEEQRYEVKFRDGVIHPFTQNNLRWRHRGSSDDIIAYRILD